MTQAGTIWSNVTDTVEQFKEVIKKGWETLCSCASADQCHASEISRPATVSRCRLPRPSFGPQVMPGLYMVLAEGEADW
jgi:hypothetical protein